MKRLCVIFVLISWAPLSATIINVPGDYPTIQEGIDAANEYDTVLVQPGIYYENVSFHGHSTTLASLYLTTGDTSYISSTIIDGNSSGSVITVGLLAHPPTIVGFTVQNGYAYSGGGIYCEPGASPTISHNIIRNNSCEYNGGGLFCEGSTWFEINDNLFTENYAGYRGGGAYFIDSDVYMNNNLVYTNTTDGSGGGIYFWESFGSVMYNTVIAGNTALIDGGGVYLKLCHHFDITYCEITGNSAPDNGGGISVWDSDLDLTNCTISRNLGGTGGGIFLDPPTFLRLENSILWADSATVEGNEIIQESNNFIIRFCDVQGGMGGGNNIDADPLFVDPENGDFHLQAGSPCIDAGDPSSPYDPDGTIVDMGAYYFGREIPEFIDQSQLIATEGFWFDEGEVRWQQFFPTLDNISSIELHIQKSGSPGNMIAQVATDFGDILSTLVVEEDNMPANDWVRANFPQTIDLVPGEPYRIYVSSSQPSPSPDERYTWNGNHDSDYPGITDVYDEESFYDYAFITYGYDIVIGIENSDVEILPEDLHISQNYPNPFNASTTLSYTLPQSGPVSIFIYNLLGQRVVSIFEGEKQAGRHTITWDATDFPTGVYFARLEAGEYSKSIKMVLLK